MFAIETHNLTKVYRRQHLLKTSIARGVENLDLSVKPGEVFGLLGLNGSGKTTTIKLLLGLLQPTAGTVSIFGNEMPSIAVLKKIGYLPEVPYFYRYLTAAEILKFYGRLSDIDHLEERVENTLAMIGLSGWKDRKLSEFSKGMLQRVGLAQSLLHDPDILVYDEPVSGLDPLAMQEMRNLLLKLRSRGKTIFLSSHLISEVEKICDRAGILAKGRLVRVMEQKDWAGKEGELERVFVEDVKDSSEMGRIKI
jgi:ABC-2 type transport system ATP-binding protein